jgi:hypothetical protein
MLALQFLRILTMTLGLERQVLLGVLAHTLPTPIPWALLVEKDIQVTLALQRVLPQGLGAQEE